MKVCCSYVRSRSRLQTALWWTQDATYATLAVIECKRREVLKILEELKSALDALGLSRETGIAYLLNKYVRLPDCT